MRTDKKESARGQSTVEFALISILLFWFILGIIEMGRFLFTFSVVTNAAQEGSHFAILRPREVVAAAQATQLAADMAAKGTPTYVPQLVAPSYACDIRGKSIDKVFGVPKSLVNIAVWYDNGNGTPIPVTQSNIDTVIKEGNRVVVEASYNYKFVVPFMDKFVPNGLDIRMRSARTILQNGKTTPPGCTIDFTPAPSYTPAPTRTPTETPLIVTTGTPPTSTRTPTGTATPTQTATSAPTFTPTVTETPGTPTATVTGTPPTSTPTGTGTATTTSTATATPSPTPKPLDIQSVQVFFKQGNGQPVQIIAEVVSNLNPVTDVPVTVKADVFVNGVLWTTATLASNGEPGEYAACPAGEIINNASVKVNVYASAPGYRNAERLNVVGIRDPNLRCGRR